MRWASAMFVVMALVGACTPAVPEPSPVPPGPAPVTVPALTGWTSAPGGFRLTPSSRVVVDPRQEPAHDEARTFAEDAEGVVGRRLPVVTEEGPGDAGDVVLLIDQNRADLGEEGYALSVGDTATITARTDAGAFYGTRTILQLLRAGGALPAGTVTDVPRYAERGVGICACVVHVSVEALRRLIQDAAYLKLNHLWLELKVKSDTFPETASWSYYTKPEVATLRELAARYHVTLVPEVDAPGHMSPWLRTRPDLQLTTADGVGDPSRLDLANPAALSYVTRIIDEYLTVFDSPFWHLGADEYLTPEDYAKHPGLLAHARTRFGPAAVAQDAFVDFVNRVNAHVKAKGKRLRIWNDGIPDVATVALDTDIIVEHWQVVPVTPGMLISRGHSLMNAAASLYDVRGGGKINAATLYERDWSPLVFEGATVPASPLVTGAKLTLWPDNGSAETENEIEAQNFLPLRFLAQATWGPTRPDADFAAFRSRAEAVGRSPGATPTGSDQVPDTPVALASGGRFLTPEAPAPGATLIAGTASTPWHLERTADGYHTLRHVETGLCAESRLGERALNTPLQAGTPITAETCATDNRLQRWQLTRTGDTVTMTNAITRMVAVLSGVLVQQIPHDRTPTAFTLR